MMSVGVLFGCAAMFFPEAIMQLYTDKAAIQEIGVEYLRVVGAAYMMQVFSMAVSSLLRSTQRVSIPLIASGASVGTNLVLNWVLIYGKLGAPAMGIRGAALATTIAAAVNLLTLYLMAWRTGFPYLFHWKGHFRWTRKHVATFFRKCFPILCNEILIGIGNMVINVTLGRQPEYVIAALAVFRTIEGLMIGFFAGFSNAASILVGACVGGGELKTAYERAKRLIYLCSGIIFLIGCAVFAVRSPLLRAMSLSGASYQAGTVFLGIYVVVAVIRMGNWIQNDTYRASGDSVFGTVAEIVFMYCMLIPCVLLSGFVWKCPYWIIFLCCYVDEPIRYILMQRHFYSKKWIKPVTEKGIQALKEL